MKAFGVFLVVVLCSLQIVLGSDNGQVMELSCSDNATCINQLTKQLVKSIKQNQTIKVFDAFTIEPIAPLSEGRASEGLVARFFNNHAIKLDFGQYGVRVKKATKKDASMELEIEDNSAVNGEARKRSKKIMQVFLPLVLGFKAASTTIVAIAAVALLTFKAFLASKLAILVTGSMLIKKLLDNFNGNSGMQQHHPYLYQQYPIDFQATAGSHPGYSMGAGGFAGSEAYGATGLGGQGHDFSQQPLSVEQPHDGAGQYSQALASIHNPNVTAKFGPTAGKRWDGIKRKSMYYDNARSTTDAYSGYQEYDPYQ